MDELIKELKDASICIYGCGEYGMQIYLLLRENGIRIKFFGDRDSKKGGYVVDSVSCIPYEELLQQKKEDITLIVAIAHGERIVEEFRKLGFKNVIFYKDIIKSIYEKLSDEDQGGWLMEIEDLKKIKRHIEEIVFTGNLSVEEKRDCILKMI